MNDLGLKKINSAIRESFKINDKLFFFRKNKKEGEVLVKLYEKAFAIVDRRPDSTVFSETGKKDIDPSYEKIYHCGVYALAIEDELEDYELTMRLVGASQGSVITRDVNWSSGKPVVFLEWVTRVTMPSLKALVSSMNTDGDKLDREIISIINNIKNEGDLDVDQEKQLG